MSNNNYLYFSLFKTMSFYRIINVIKIYSSYWISSFFKKPIHWGKPISISVEPTTSCNLSCPECPSGLKKFSRPTGKLNKEDFQVVLNQMHRHLQYITFYFQGEPLLHKEFTTFVRMAKEKKIFVATSTNAHFLTKETAYELIESRLDRLIISLDGVDPETYAKYRRGGDFDQVLGNIKTMVEARNERGTKHPFLELQFLVLKHNQQQIEEIKDLGKLLGVDKVVLKTAQVYEFEDGNDFIPDIDKYTRYEKQDDGKYKIKSKLPNKCFRMWSGCVVTWDTQIVPCCFDKDADYKFGSLKNDRFDKIWKNPQYDSFRQQILEDRSQIDICRNCSEGL